MTKEKYNQFQLYRKRADHEYIRMAQVLGVPERYELVCMLPVGIAAQESTAPEKKSFAERAWFNAFGKAENEK